MFVPNDKTFAQGCEEYLDNCCARNLRDGTIKHYRDIAEMDKIRKMAAIGGNAYNTVVKWFNNTFENTADYKMVFIGDIENKPEETANIESLKAA